MICILNFPCTFTFTYFICFWTAAIKMMRNDDCLGRLLDVGGCEEIRLCSVLVVRKAGFNLADVQEMFKVMSFCLMLACNCFLHWQTASSITFCNLLANVSTRRCFKSLVTAAGIADRCLYNVHTFLHQSTNSVVNQTIWQTQIWRYKIWCFLLNELDCFTSIEECQNALCPSQLFKNKVSKSEGTRKVGHT